MSKPSTNNTVRTRIAPSPTGYPHIGTIYQALFDYAFAKKHKGNFIIRIEDTDRTRFVEDAEIKLYEAIDWFNLSEDESPRKGGKYSPYVQSQRLELYAKHAADLIEKGHAYYCFCSKERLETIREAQQKANRPIMYDKYCRSLSEIDTQNTLSSGIPYVIRMKIPENKTIVAKDEIRGEIQFDSNLVDDQVLLKADGFPTYHLAAMVDDHFMQITHVVRGEEWIPSFPKHVLLYEFFGWEMPLFYHTSALRNPDKSKLSKRHSHTNISWYRQEGYLPEAILNFMALLGWSNPKGEELFTVDEFIELFDLKDIKPIGPIFDLAKLEWMNGMYIRNLSDTVLKEKLLAYDPTLQAFLSDERNDVIVPLAKTRMKTLKDFKKLISDPETGYVYIEEDKHIIEQLLPLLEKLIVWESEVLLELVKNFAKEQEVSMKKMYLLLTGKDQGLPLFDFLVWKGKEDTLIRLKNIVR